MNEADDQKVRPEDKLPQGKIQTAESPLATVPKTLFGQYEILALIGLAIVLVGFNYSVFSKEQVLKTGVPIKLALAPRDPRALLTGDYMALNTDVSNKIRQDVSKRRDGFVIVKLDGQGVGQFLRVQELAGTLASDELAIKFRARENGVKVGPNAFYFQEGFAKPFEQARFGEYRLASNGDVLLMNMLDEKMVVIKPVAAPN
jgi:uncharacterized membrane-anchored protein